VSGSAQPLDAGGIRAVRGHEVAAAPEREALECRGRRPDEVVPFRGAVDRRLGVPDGGVDVAPDERQACAVHRDRGGQTGQLALVDDDRGCPRPAVVPRLQQALDVAAGQSVPDRGHRLLVLLVPGAGPAMQVRDVVGAFDRQVGAQE
jgi:hypothetical protein